MLNSGASKPRVRAPPPPDQHLNISLKEFFVPKGVVTDVRLPVSTFSIAASYSICNSSHLLNGNKSTCINITGAVVSKWKDRDRESFLAYVR